MPITLNHSNISVQYETGSNYIIETVKSDLFLRNENVDTVIRNNIQTAPVTPTTFVDSSGNVFGVEAYTYSGTANTADYTRVFPKNTTCDILIVGGGGGGGFAHGGGGGAGQLVLIHQATLNGSYTIKVGNGGVGGLNLSTPEPTKGINSEFGSVIAEGGGANGKTLKDGGSGAGGDGYTPSGGTTGGGNKNTTIDTFPGATVYSRGNNGGNNGGTDNGVGGGGGGTGEAGTTGQNSYPYGKGGDGLSGISEINYDFKTNFGINVGKTESDEKVWFAAGGGGGGLFAGFGGKGGGGAGAPNNNTKGFDATNNTGSGGGGGGGNGNEVMGGKGGSGIVIIKYLLGTIPTTNFLTNEPVVTAPTFTETIRTFVHSGGTENQTSYNITIGQNTICDILIVGGGGAGGYDRGGGGGAGGLVFQTNIVLSGTINISVGRGGSVASNDTTTGGNGFNSSIGSIVALGGGGGGSEQTNASDGGSGGGSSYSYTMSHFGTGLQPTSTSGGYGNIGGDARDLTNTTINRGSGGGGGAGSRGLEATSAVGGAGGDGLSGVGNVDFKTHFNLPTDNTIGQYISQENKVYFAGGGGGGECIDGQPSASIHGLGGKGGGSNGATNAGVMGSALQNSGGGGGGGGDDPSSTKAGSNGGSGIVIIKFKSITNAAVSEGNPTTTHKRLNFAYVPPLIYNFTPYNDLASWTAYATSFGATTLFNYFDSTGAWHVPSNGYVQLTLPNAYNQVKVNYNNPHVSGTFVRIYIDNVLKDTCTAGSSREYIQSYTSGQVLKIEEEGAIIGKNLIITLTNTNTNQYTLNFPVPTTTDINNNSNIVLQGAYDIALDTSNSSIIPKSNQYIPKPSTFSTSNISLRYHLLNPILDPTGAQWTYSSNNTNVYHMGSVGIGTTTPEYSLDVRGNIFTSTGGYTQTGLTTWSITSDRRIKENIVKASYDKCLENVKNIELYNFNFKDNYVNTNDRRQLGFIAQEVQQVYPKAVEVGKMILNLEEKIDDLLTLNTTQIDYTLYGAVKGLIHKMENIKIKMEQIKGTSNITTQA